MSQDWRTVECNVEVEEAVVAIMQISMSMLFRADRII